MGVDSGRGAPDRPDPNRDNRHYPFESAPQKWWWDFTYAMRTGSDDIHEVTETWLTRSHLDRQWFYYGGPDSGNS